jgi:hypothetical protein
LLQRKGHSPEAAKATVDLAAHPEAAEQEPVTEQGLAQEAVTEQGLDRERGEQVPELAQVAEQDLGGEPEQAAEREAVTEQGLDREQVPAPVLEEQPARLQEREPRIPAGVVTQAAPVEESRAVAVQAQKALAEVDPVQVAVPGVAIVAARELAFCLATKAAAPAMAADLAQVSVAEQAAEMAVAAKPGAVPEERVLASASPVKKGSTAFCAR